MEIARLTAICSLQENEVRQCGHLENEIVRLRAQVAALEERNATLEEGKADLEEVYALFEKQLVREDAKLEAEENEKAG
jgi:hypothetical protein